MERFNSTENETRPDWKALMDEDEICPDCGGPDCYGECVERWDSPSWRDEDEYYDSIDPREQK